MTASPEYLRLRRLPDSQAERALIEASMVPIASIIAAASEVFDVGPRDMRSHYRAHHIAHARHAVCKVASEIGWPLVDAAAELRRDRCTARDSRNRAAVLERTNPTFSARLAELRARTMEKAA